MLWMLSYIRKEHSIFYPFPAAGKPLFWDDVIWRYRENVPSTAATCCVPLQSVTCCIHQTQWMTNHYIGLLTVWCDRWQLSQQTAWHSIHCMTNMLWMLCYIRKEHSIFYPLPACLIVKWWCCGEIHCYNQVCQKFIKKEKKNDGPNKVTKMSYFQKRSIPLTKYLRLATFQKGNLGGYLYCQDVIGPQELS